MGFVFIIESPSSEDLLDGKTEGKTLIEALRLSGINGWYSLVTSKATFYKTLQERLSMAINAFPGKWPILHFSMHGDSQGLAVSNNEFISWDELRVALNELNNAMQGRSLVCMSSCKGASAIQMAMIESEEKPFGALIGNTRTVAWSDAAVAYVTFYHQFFKDVPLPVAVEAMKIASGDDHFMYWEGEKIKNGWASFIQNKKFDLNLLPTDLY